MIFGADLSAVEHPVICPFPPTPQNCIYFYINDPVQTELVDNPGFTTKPASIVVGPQLKRINLALGKHHLMVCVAFHPGGLHRLLGIPLTELMYDIDSVTLFGNEINSINEQLKEVSNWNQLKNIVETFLLKKSKALKDRLPFDLSMIELVKMDGNLSIEKVASLACLSLRQFERKCQERLGISPKFFARLTRFSKAYRLKENNHQLSWTSIAYECGYFDQMHLIRDFREFAGVTPRIMEHEWAETPLRLQANIRM